MAIATVFSDIGSTRVDDGAVDCDMSGDDIFGISRMIEWVGTVFGSNGM